MWDLALCSLSMRDSDCVTREIERLGSQCEAPRQMDTKLWKTNPTASCTNCAAPRISFAISAERTQRQAVPIVLARKRVTQFLPNEPNGKLCRFCSQKNGSGNFCQTNPTANSADFAAPKSARAISAKRTQRQAVTVLRTRKSTADFAK
jgi:hypothetical protein